MTRITYTPYLLMTALVVSALPALAQGRGEFDTPARYPVAISGEEDLLQVFAAGAVGDALGYDAHEVLYHARAAGMPTGEIVPVFHAAFLAGRNFSDVIERRARGDRWGSITHDMGVDAETLNRMGIPRAVTFTDPREVPDEVFEDMFMTATLARAYGVDPDDAFRFYEAGWTALDVLAAVQIGMRTDRHFSRYLSGEPRRVDWLEQARRAGVSLSEVARSAGRSFDNDMPVALEEPLRPDLELMYAEELARERWAVPVRDIRHARYRFLYTPSEMLVSFHLADLGGFSYIRVGRAYSWERHRQWGPTIVLLNIPPRHFVALPVWGRGPVDFYAVDPYLFHGALVGHILAWGSPLRTDFYYTHYSPWFGPPDAIVFYSVHRRYHVPFDDFYSWRRTGRPWHSYQHVSKDYGQLRRSQDWIGKRRVGAVLGEKLPAYGAPPVTRPRTVPGAVLGDQYWGKRTAGRSTYDPGYPAGKVTTGRPYDPVPGKSSLTGPPATVGPRPGPPAVTPGRPYDPVPGKSSLTGPPATVGPRPGPPAVTPGRPYDPVPGKSSVTGPPATVGPRPGPPAVTPGRPYDPVPGKSSVTVPPRAFTPPQATTPPPSAGRYGTYKGLGVGTVPERPATVTPPTRTWDARPRTETAPREDQGSRRVLGIRIPDFSRSSPSTTPASPKVRSAPAPAPRPSVTPQAPAQGKGSTGGKSSGTVEGKKTN